MKKFLYKAKSGPEKLVEGVISALTEKEALESLSQKGYVATYLKELGTPARGEGSSQDSKAVDRPAGSKELISFTRQLSVLLRAGIPLIRGLDIMSSQMRQANFGKVIEDISNKIKNGETLSSGMSAYKRIFSDFYRATVMAGEESGTIDKSLERLAEYFQKQDRLMAKIRVAMAYPVFIFFVGILTVIFVFTNVMPKIIPVLISLETELPFPTRMLIFMSDFLREKWMWGALGIFIIGLITKRAMANKSFENHFSAFKLKIPVFGGLILKSELSRFTRAMEICLRSGISATNSTGISLSLIGEPYLKNKLEGSVGSLERGRSLTETFSGSGVFPIFALNLINVGEESGDLSGSMGNISDAFEIDCADAVDVALGLLEPAMVLIVGLIVGFIVSAVLLPVFQMNFIQL